MRVFDENFFNRAPGQDNRLWLDGMLREIGAHLPRMLREHDRRHEFWDWFCGETDSALRTTTAGSDRLYFRQQVNRLLEEAGLPERLVESELRRNPQCTE